MIFSFVGEVVQWDCRPAFGGMVSLHNSRGKRGPTQSNLSYCGNRTQCMRLLFSCLLAPGFVRSHLPPHPLGPIACGAHVTSSTARTNLYAASARETDPCDQPYRGGLSRVEHVQKNARLLLHKQTFKPPRLERLILAINLAAGAHRV